MNKFKLSLYIFAIIITITFAGNKKGGTDKTKNELLRPIGVVGRKKIFVGIEKMKWADALDLCHSFDYEVAVIENREENDIVCEYLGRKNLEVGWIGATDLFSEGNWRWFKSAERVLYSNWEKPEKDKLKNCAYVQEDGFWYNTYCSSDRNYPLCQLVWI